MMGPFLSNSVPEYNSKRKKKQAGGEKKEKVGEEKREINKETCNRRKAMVAFYNELERKGAKKKKGGGTKGTNQISGVRPGGADQLPRP